MLSNVTKNVKCVKTEISAGEKFAFRTFFAGEAILTKINFRQFYDVNWHKINYN